MKGCPKNPPERDLSFSSLLNMDTARREAQILGISILEAALIAA